MDVWIAEDTAGEVESAKDYKGNTKNTWMGERKNIEKIYCGRAIFAK